jgi:hypothetical protein
MTIHAAGVITDDGTELRSAFPFEEPLLAGPLAESKVTFRTFEV